MHKDYRPGEQLPPNAGNRTGEGRHLLSPSGTSGTASRSSSPCRAVLLRSTCRGAFLRWRTAVSRRQARAARSRFRRVPLTSPERPTLGPSRPAQPWWRRRDASPRNESVPPSSRVRRVRCADGPRPRGQRTLSRQRVPFNKSPRSGHLVLKKVDRSIKRPSACTRRARDRYGRDVASVLSL